MDIEKFLAEGLAKGGPAGFIIAVWYAVLQFYKVKTANNQADKSHELTVSEADRAHYDKEILRLTTERNEERARLTAEKKEEEQKCEAAESQLKVCDQKRIEALSAQILAEGRLVDADKHRLHVMEECRIQLEVIEELKSDKKKLEGELKAAETERDKWKKWYNDLREDIQREQEKQNKRTTLVMPEPTPEELTDMQ